MDVSRDVEILDSLEMHDMFSAVKVTDRRRNSWLVGARPGDRWAVTLTEGGTFSYGRSLRDAISNAIDGV